MSNKNEYISGVFNQMIKGGRSGVTPGTKEQLENFKKKYKDIVEYVADLMPSNKYGCLAAVLCKSLIKYNDKEKVYQFINKFKNCLFEGDNDPVYLLWKYITNKRKKTHSAIYQRCVCAVKSYMEGKKNIPVLRAIRTDIVEFEEFSYQKEENSSEYTQKLKNKLGELYLMKDGSIVCGNNKNEIPKFNNVIQIAAGESHYVILTKEGKIYCFGSNEFKQLESPTEGKFIRIASGKWHSIALSEDGKIVVWGDNEFNQHNVPNNCSDVQDISADKYSCIAICKNGSVIWGKNS